MGRLWLCGGYWHWIHQWTGVMVWERLGISNSIVVSCPFSVLGLNFNQCLASFFSYGSSRWWYYLVVWASQSVAGGIRQHQDRDRFKKRVWQSMTWLLFDGWSIHCWVVLAPRLGGMGSRIEISTHRWGRSALITEARKVVIGPMNGFHSQGP